jgi:hypothetical protein
VIAAILRTLVSVSLLVLSACADYGPPSEANITEDIRSDRWTRSMDLPPLEPGAAPPIATGGFSRRVIP